MQIKKAKYDPYEFLTDKIFLFNPSDSSEWYPEALYLSAGIQDKDYTFVSDIGAVEGVKEWRADFMFILGEFESRIIYYKAVGRIFELVGKYDIEVRLDGSETCIAVKGNFIVENGKVNEFIDDLFSVRELLAQYGAEYDGASFSDRLVSETEGVTGTIRYKWENDSVKVDYCRESVSMPGNWVDVENEDGKTVSINLDLMESEIFRDNPIPGYSDDPGYNGSYGGRYPLS